MREVEEALYEFIDRLQETEEFLEYQEAKKALEGYPQLKAEIDAFRQKNFELSQSDGDPARLLEEVDKLERQVETFRENPLVNDFLSSELAFIRLMQKVYRIITDSIDFE